MSQFGTIFGCSRHHNVLESHRPVHEIEIDVVQSQIKQCLFKRVTDMFTAVIRVVEFGCNEKFVTLIVT